VRGDTVRHLFVYGTLRRGSNVPQAAWLAAQARYKGQASLPGRLLDLGDYPGLLPAQSPEEKVYGDLFELPEGQEVLEALDRYEGCHGEDPEPHEYCRIVATPTDEDGVRVWAWTYLYQLPVDPSRQIKGGDWLKRNDVVGLETLERVAGVDDER